MRKAGHVITCGKPCEMAARNLKEHAGLKEHTTLRAGAARHGGVAIAARLPQTLVTRDLICQETAELVATGRWTEAFAPVRVPGRRGTGIYLASMWGHPGARQDPESMRSNEALITMALEAAARVGDAPYIIGMDANVQVQESLVLTQALATGIWCDALEVAPLRLEDATSPTHCNAKGWDRRSWQQGASRIDMVLINSAARHLVSGAWLQRESEIPAHLGDHG